MKTKMTQAEVDALFQERCKIEAWLDPTPDPAVWPPKGWQVHPTAPGFLVRVVSELALREELFGSPKRDEYIKQAKARLEEIDKTLAAYFFPKPKTEGTQRKTAHGFVAMLKTGLKRVVDIAALPDVLNRCPAGTEDKLIEWKPALKLKAFRELPPKVSTIFESALVIEPEKPKFEIVKQADEDEA